MEDKQWKQHFNKIVIWKDSSDLIYNSKIQDANTSWISQLILKSRPYRDRGWVGMHSVIFF